MPLYYASEYEPISIIRDLSHYAGNNWSCSFFFVLTPSSANSFKAYKMGMNNERLIYFLLPEVLRNYRVWTVERVDKYCITKDHANSVPKRSDFIIAYYQSYQVISWLSFALHKTFRCDDGVAEILCIAWYSLSRSKGLKNRRLSQ